MTKDKNMSNYDFSSVLNKKITSTDARKASDLLFNASTEELAQAYINGQIESNSLDSSELDFELTDEDKEWLNDKPQGKEVL